MQLYKKIRNHLSFSNNNSSELSTKLKIEKLQKVAEQSMDSCNVAKLEIMLQEATNLAKDIKKAKASSNSLQKYDKRGHYKRNLHIIHLLKNKRFIRFATNKKYRNFNKLPKYIPAPIVLELNKKGFKQDNGNEHTVDTITYIADLHREQVAIKKIISKRNRKIVAVAIFTIAFAMMLYVRVKTNQPLQLGTTLQQFQVAKEWSDNEIIVKIQLYATAEEITITEWRTGKILEVTKNRNLTESELIYKIDSVVNYKY